MKKNYSEKDKILALGNIKLNDITQNHLWKILQKQVGDVDGVYEYLDTLAKLTPQKERAKFYCALFSESGFDKKIEIEAENSDIIRLYDLKTIVNYNKPELFTEKL